MNHFRKLTKRINGFIKYIKTLYSIIFDALQGGYFNTIVLIYNWIISACITN